LPIEQLQPRVVKIQTFITTTDGVAESRDVRARYLPDEPPASTAVRVAALMVPDGLIEVDVAVIPAGG
jgi:enamine deaminase RidA (YjgF/YER057c/UK114 family)